MSIYLDNAATTKPCREAVKAIYDCLDSNYGNPSSLHHEGVRAQIAVDEVRKMIGRTIAADPECIYFTSGATESNNLAVLGSVGNGGKKKNRIVSTAVEHPSVDRALSRLEEKGFEVVRIAPDKNGNISHERIINAVDSNTALVSIMLVNNETGYIMPVRRAFYGIKKLYPGCLTHCDAVQGYMKIPFKVSELSADMVSLSGHKICGPKGIGALYVRKGIHIKPRTFGGGQEKGLRSGTENVPMIVGMGAAVKALSRDINERYSKAQELKAMFLKKISELENVTVNSSEDASPYIINISVPGIRSEIMLHFLEERGIYISSGSACSKGEKSSVLKSFGLCDELVDSALRISLGRDTIGADLSALAEGISDARKSLLKAK